MHILADCGLIVTHLVIFILVTSALQTGQFQEDSLSLDIVTDSTGLHGGSTRGSVTAGASRTKKARVIGTLDKGNTAASRDQPTAYRHDSSHCMNGGTGFLRTFCFCRAEYTGRYCEQRVNSSCDSIDHGQWVYRNCSYCKCADGVFECRLHELEGCRKTTETAKHHDNKDNGLALETVSHNGGGVPQVSMLGLVTSLVVAIHRILGLRNAPVR